MCIGSYVSMQTNVYVSTGCAIEDYAFSAQLRLAER
jgi:hypothetical protein